jgi:hypothetical protein
MSRLRKIAPWLNVITGLVWMLPALFNIYKPGFLSIGISHLSNAEKASLAPLFLTVGVLWFVVGLLGLYKIRHNPEGKVPPAVTTIFGPQS